jgi:hypothetical protein
MALKKLKGIKVGRLIVLILIIAIPAFFFVLIDAFKFITPEDFMFFGQSGIPFLPAGWAKFFVWFCAPVFFSLPWVSFLIIDRNRIAEAIDNMGRALSKVSIGLNIFYSVNALFIFVFFIMPFGSPAICVIAAFGLIPWIVRRKTGARVPIWISFIPGVLLGAIPVILAIGFYWNYGPIWDSIWSAWVGGAASGTLIQQYGWVHVLYGFGYSVAIGAVAAGFVAFMYEGASRVDPYQRRPKGILYIFEFLIAAGVFTIYMILDVGTQTRKILFLVLSIVSVSLAGLEFLLRFFKKIRRSDDDNVPISAYIILPLFIAVDFIRQGKVPFFREYALTIALAVACLIYFIIFIMAYSFAGETYPSRWSGGSEPTATTDSEDYDEE